MYIDKYIKHEKKVEGCLRAVEQTIKSQAILFFRKNG